MAKGRKLTTSRSELFIRSFGYDQGSGTLNGSSELAEDEVWSMVDDTVSAVNGDDHLVTGEWSSHATSVINGSFDSYRSRRPPRRTNSHRRQQIGGLSLAFDDPVDGAASSPSIVHQFRVQDIVAESARVRHVAASAPVNVPDWSKIHRVDSVESLHDSDDGLNDESELVPPHEYLARQYASSRKMAANSVFEGVGRTLKGRDLSRVRDAVWSQTGFDG